MNHKTTVRRNMSITCEFSETISAVNAQLSLNFLAHFTGTRLTVRDAESLEVEHVYQCLEKPDKIEFSPDGQYIACTLLTKGCVQCFSMDDKEWKCRINEGSAGLINVFWHPDSRGLITVSDFGVQMAFYSLTDASSSIITNPKQGIGYLSSSGSSTAAHQQLLSFSDCTKFLAVVHRMDLQDYIGVYSVVGPVIELAKFKCRNNANDVTSVSWTPNSTHIVAIDSPLSYRIGVYTAAGDVVGQYEAYQSALGIRTMGYFRPTGPRLTIPTAKSSAQLLALGSYDGKIRLLSIRSWQPAFVLPLVHPREMDVGVWEETQMLSIEVIDGVSSIEGLTLLPHEEITVNEADKRRNRPVVVGSNIKYVTRRALAIKSLPRIQPDPRNSKMLPPQQGVSWMGRSHNGRILAAREASMTRCLWIWDPLEGKLIDLVVQMDPITCAQWRPSRDMNNSNDENQAPPPSSGGVTIRAIAYEGEVSTEDPPPPPSAPTSSSSLSVQPPPPPPPFTTEEHIQAQSQDHQDKPVLAFCTGSSRVYFWTPGGLGIQWVDVKSSMNNSSFASTNTGTTTLTTATGLAAQTIHVTSLVWSRDGRRLLLRGRDCCQTCEVDVEKVVS